MLEWNVNLEVPTDLDHLDGWMELNKQFLVTAKNSLPILLHMYNYESHTY